MVRWTRGVSPSAIALAVACSGHVEDRSVPVGTDDVTESSELPAGAAAEAPPESPEALVDDARDGPREAGAEDTQSMDEPVAFPTLGPAALHRLTGAQSQNVLASLVGEGVRAVVRERVDPHFNGLAAIAMTELAMSTIDVERADLDASSVARWVVEDAERRSDVVGCDVATSDCLESFVERFGRQAWRRPLTSDEIERYYAVAESAATSTAQRWEGVRWAITALLQSPHFLYRAEIGSADDADATSRVLGDHELASRLAFALTEAPPDTELSEAADDGTLRRDLASHVERLSSGEPATRAATRVVTEHLQLFRLAPGGEGTGGAVSPSLAADMQAQTQATVESLVRADADFRTLFTTPDTFLTPALAELYDVEMSPTGSMQPHRFAEASPRKGVLGHASLLALYADGEASSPTRRGRFIRENLLCEAVGSPPAGVESERPEQQDASTRRERVESWSANPSCAECHRRMDPLGLALEGFDGTGRYRHSDQGEAIDATGALDETPVNGAVELAEALSEDQRVPRCLVHTAFRRTAGALASPSEQPVLDDVEHEFRESQYRVAHLVRSVVLHPAFERVRALDEEQAL